MLVASHTSSLANRGKCLYIKKLEPALNRYNIEEIASGASSSLLLLHVI